MIFTIYRFVTFGIVLDADNEESALQIASKSELQNWRIVASEEFEIYEGDETLEGASDADTI